MALTISVYNCQRCGHQTLSFQEWCPSCQRSGSYYPQEMEIRGTVTTSVKVHVPDEKFTGEVPYQLIWVDCGNDLRLKGRLHPTEKEIEIGTEVELASYIHETPIFKSVFNKIKGKAHFSS